MDALSRAIDAVAAKQPGIEVRLDEPMKNHTSFKIGGPVRAMFFPGDADCLAELCGILGKHGIIPVILGNGSNILACDKHLDIAIVNMLKLNSVELSGANNPCSDDNSPDSNAKRSTQNACSSAAENQTEVTAGAGALLSKLAVFAYEHGLTGLEFAHGIPGSFGGAVVMNAGAYNSEMKNVVLSTTAYNIKTGKYTVTGAQHDFSYRHSRFSNTDDVVLSSVVRLQHCDKKTIKQKMDELTVRRHKSQPLDIPSAGSTFKRPKEGYAAALIEQAELKGFTIGGAAVSEKHAGFIVNHGGASFRDVMEVIEHVREVVFKQFGVGLELEVKIIS